MKGQIRNIYPGGNTPKGFYSYYNYILPQREAEKFFCIKGGPGTGKSTLMKEVARYFAEKGEAVDLLWCSSDPDSLDGVLLKQRDVAIVDGTAPHVVDPKTPGAVDEIINLGRFWDEKGIRQHRDDILDCSERIAETFENVYGYLRCAETQYDFMERLSEKCMAPGKKIELHQMLDMMVIPAGSTQTMGHVKKAFAGAITPAGLRNEVAGIMGEADNVIIIDVPAGVSAGKLLLSASERLCSSGLDVEEYYCPMRPEKSPEHIFCPEASLAIATCNTFHDVRDSLQGKNCLEIKVFPEGAGEDPQAKILAQLQQSSRRDICNALRLLENAKAYHDELEGYYIPYMDFSEIDKVRDEIIEKIETL